MKYKILAALLCLCALLLSPALAMPGDGGHTVQEYDTTSYKFEITGDVDSEVWIYTTPNSGDVKCLNAAMTGDVRIFYVDYDSEKWRFAGWKHWYKSGTVDKENPNHNIGNTWYFSTVDSRDVKYNGTDEFIQVNKELFYGGTFYLYAIFEPIVSVSADAGVESYSVSGATKVSDGKYAVRYGNSATVSFRLKEGYVLDDVSPSYGTSVTLGPNNAAINDVIRPGGVSIRTRRKSQTVYFYANGGSGGMDSQHFAYGVSQSLSLNAFALADHHFSYWLAESGARYSDGQALTLCPADDASTLSLTAQWEACNYVKVACGFSEECKVCSAPNGVISGHSMGEWQQSIAPTATEPGEEIRHCADCPHFETRPVPPLGVEEDENETPIPQTGDGAQLMLWLTLLCLSLVSIIYTGKKKDAQ